MYHDIHCAGNEIGQTALSIANHITSLSVEPPGSVIHWTAKKVDSFKKFQMPSGE